MPQLLKLTQVISDPLTKPGQMLVAWLEAFRVVSLPDYQEESGHRLNIE